LPKLRSGGGGEDTALHILGPQSGPLCVHDGPALGVVPPVILLLLAAGLAAKLRLMQLVPPILSPAKFLLFLRVNSTSRKEGGMYLPTKLK
jgi:hypothetical protein